MKYTDTRDRQVSVSFKDAVMGGMNAQTGGLYVPCSFPALDAAFLKKTPTPSFHSIAYAMAQPYLDGEIPAVDLHEIIQDAYPFVPKIQPLDRTSAVLELFHGPTCAFKDFGARFMARVMAYFNRTEEQPLHILVATSGDTGSAVGSAFHHVPGIDVTILYPDGKISALQEKQLATFTDNVRALKVNGTFDDCQKLVKTAFTDGTLRTRFRLSSANSINIARLLPQAFYYMYAALTVRERYARGRTLSPPAIIMSVPSGNFGNLTSGVIARMMGAPITGFIAATNSNRTIPDWLATGTYDPRPSVETYANAMDVGAPSNYERIAHLYTLEDVRKLCASFWTDNAGIKKAITSCMTRTGYIFDPHGAIGWQAWYDLVHGALGTTSDGTAHDWQTPGVTPTIPDWAPALASNNAVGVILETAHPGKFPAVVSEAIGCEPPMPQALLDILRLPDRAIPMENDYAQFKSWLTDTFTR